MTKRIERIRWRCRRGLLELDLLLQRFLNKYDSQLNEQQIDQFESLLSLSDNDLLAIICSNPETVDKSLKRLIQLIQRS
ncbi:MAG TPA: succinate dehydrogenase assembly factor 2 [Nitrosomonas sp.]|nr:succinate dehydrogenase assembly factor 2 [Nitrosomonas sp.]HMW20968.1 succinate dehydrogenase assembly factor 2 [Nitrosomonas sp.]HMW68907.1 succinate dehydrogenase assembly factor 2 [Nitrosomonas sp.]HMY61260.1 succinate dehydrogenase assembly factor 2 [Nitrosomonas sp.]HMY89943.1 succinate dehydrogenase assembly factor 2 [Nitrosomonas sp.]